MDHHAYAAWRKEADRSLERSRQRRLENKSYPVWLQYVILIAVVVVSVLSTCAILLAAGAIG